MNLQMADNNQNSFMMNDSLGAIDKMGDFMIDNETNYRSQKKLEKNRDTARISRMRKKYYIDLLEKKLEQLT